MTKIHIISAILGAGKTTFIKQLLKEAIDMVEYNMNVIRSTRMSSGSSNYSSDASEVAGMAPQHGMFDAKQ